MEQAAPATTTPLSIWRNPPFLRVWVAQTVSVFGSQFTVLALPLIAVTTLQASPTEMGLLVAAGYAPYLFVGPFAGIWVDRLPRRPILIACNVSLALLMATIPLAALAGMLSLPHLLIVALLAGVATVVYELAYQAYLPSLLPLERLVEGNSKLEVSQSAARIAGPGVAGFVIQVFSAPFAIALDALSFLLSALLIWPIRRAETPSPKARAPMLAEVREGLTVFLASPLLRAVASGNAMLNFFLGAISALFILYVTRELELEPTAIGVVLGLGNASALAGAFLAGWLPQRVRFGQVLVGSALLIGLANVPLALATPALALPLLILRQLLFSLATPIYSVSTLSLRQTVVPQHLQGRVTASIRVLVLGVTPLGSLAGGALGQLLDLRATIAIAAVGTLLAFLWILFSPVRSLKSVPEQVSYN